MMTHQHPEEEEDVKKRPSVELWLQGQQLHRMQGAEPQRQDAFAGRAGTAPTASSPFPAARSILLGPTACCLVNISKPAQSPPMPGLRKDTYSPDVTPFNFQA